MEANGTVKRPDWFLPKEVSEFERQFIAQQKLHTSEPIYLQARNLMICAWRSLPHLYLNLSSCAEQIHLDYFELKKIHAFLMENKLINVEELTMKSSVPQNVIQNPLT